MVQGNVMLRCLHGLPYTVGNNIKQAPWRFHCAVFSSWYGFVAERGHAFAENFKGEGKETDTCYLAITSTWAKDTSGLCTSGCLEPVSKVNRASLSWFCGLTEEIIVDWKEHIPVCSPLLESYLAGERTTRREKS